MPLGGVHVAPITGLSLQKSMTIPFMAVVTVGVNPTEYVVFVWPLLESLNLIYLFVSVPAACADCVKNSGNTLLVTKSKTPATRRTLWATILLRDMFLFCSYNGIFVWGMNKLTLP
jgi:hypothetical protein